jgi:putative restriction endonuclease
MKKVKEPYDYRCQVCDVYLSSPCGPIAIVAHIRGVGRPHDGPDVIENMLCLCPNHHDQLDCFSYYIETKSLKIIRLDNLIGRKPFV